MFTKHLVVIISVGLLLGAGRLTFADSPEIGAEANIHFSSAPAHGSALARLAASFEDRISKLRERLLKERERLEEKMEKKREQIEKKFERQVEELETKVERKTEKIEHRPPVATSTPATPLILEIGSRGHVFMRGFVASNASSTIGVRSWGGTWNVLISSTTRLLARATTTTPDFLVGDYVGIEGTISTTTSLTVEASLVRDWTP